MRFQGAVIGNRHGLEAVLLIGAALVLGGCSTPIPSAPADNPIAAARELRDAPEVVREGSAADTCGEFVLDQGDGVPVDAIACLDAARQEEKIAELAWSSLTMEGDPIVRFAFAAPYNEGVVVFTTYAFDSYVRDPRWSTQTCIDTTAAIGDSGGCSEQDEG
ncbi:MAG: hypothetical protein JWQ43_171 [Glaciihabitans sp.]|nr:hypothetical protein [Glaciihabitans sp.]